MMLICILLCGVVVLQTIMHRFERRDLYNRIMSRDLTEFKGKSSPLFSKHKKILDSWNGEKK